MGRHLAYLPDHCYQDSPFFFYFGHELLILRALLLVHSNYPEWRKAVTRLSLKFPYLQLSLEDYLLGIFLEGQQANKKQIVGDLSDNYDKLRNCEGIPLS